MVRILFEPPSASGVGGSLSDNDKAEIAKIAALDTAIKQDGGELVAGESVSQSATRTYTIGLYFVRVTDPDAPMQTVWIAIDSKVPCKPGGKSSCIFITDGQPLAAALLMKAAATVRGGSINEITNSATLKRKFLGWFPQVVKTCSTFAEFKAAIEADGQYVFSMSQQYDATGGKVTPSGVVYAHAFGAVEAIEGPDYQLVRVENPWASGSDFVSEYSDDAPFWDAHPELAEYKLHSIASKGNYWVSWETFKKLTGKSTFDVKVPANTIS